MYLASIVTLALSAFAAAQSGPNPLVPLVGTVQAGAPTTINWAPNTGGTVSLLLRWGSAGNLNAGVPIATGLPNNGAYTWTPDPNLKAGSDYTIEIYSDQDRAQTNFSPVFGLASNGMGIEVPTPSLSAAATTTMTENPASHSVAAASSSAEAPKGAEASKTSSKNAAATTNAAAKLGGGAMALTGIGAIVVGAL